MKEGRGSRSNNNQVLLLLSLLVIITITTIVEGSICPRTVSWINPVILGLQVNNNNNNNNNSTNVFGLNMPFGLSCVNQQLVITENGPGNRVLVFNTTGITNGSSAFVSLNAVNLTAKGMYRTTKPTAAHYDYSLNGSTDATVVWVGNVQTNQFYQYDSPFSFDQEPDDVTIFNPYVSVYNSRITIDLQNGYLYTADDSLNRVLKFHLDDLSTPIMIYGQVSLNQTKQNQGNSTASSSTLAQPQQVLLGCQGDIWIVDRANHRLLHFFSGSNVADIVIGQLNFNERIPNGGFVNGIINSQGFNSPVAASLNQQCTMLFVTDPTNDRLVRFDAPFTSGMSGSIFQDILNPKTNSLNNISESQYMSDMTLDEENSTVWMAYPGNNRVIGVQTSTNTVDLQCETIKNDSYASYCVVTDAVVVSSSLLRLNILNLQNFTNLLIFGNLTMDNSSEIVMNSNQMINSLGTIQFAGNLVLNLTNTDVDTVTTYGSATITLALFNQSSTGQFRTIQVLNSCDYTYTTDYNANGGKYFQIKIQRPLDGSSSLSVAAIVGIIIGGVAAIVVSTIAIAVLLIVTFKDNYKVIPEVLI